MKRNNPDFSRCSVILTKHTLNPLLPVELKFKIICDSLNLNTEISVTEWKRYPQKMVEFYGFTNDKHKVIVRSEYKLVDDKEEIAYTCAVVSGFESVQVKFSQKDPSFLEKVRTRLNRFSFKKRKEPSFS